MLGNLTAEILTPALHAELSNVAPNGRAGRARRRAHAPRNRGRGTVMTKKQRHPAPRDRGPQPRCDLRRRPAEGLGDRRRRPAGLGQDDPRPADLLSQRLAERAASSTSTRSRSRPRRRCATSSQFAFFDAEEARRRSIQFVDLGVHPADEGPRGGLARSSWSTSRRSSRPSSSSTASRSSTTWPSRRRSCASSATSSP